MSIEGQPNTILTVYSPFAWIEDPTATTSGSFVNYPVAQNALITFPNTIKINNGIQLNYPLATFSGNDTILGGYKVGTYKPASPSLSINTTQQRIIGTIATELGQGMYQLNVTTILSSSLLNPYLFYAIYVKTTSGGNFVNGDLRGTTGLVQSGLQKLNRNPTTSATELYTLSISGLLTIQLPLYVAVIVGNGDITLSQNLTYIDTYLTVTRVG